MTIFKNLYNFVSVKKDQYDIDPLRTYNSGLTLAAGFNITKELLQEVEENNIDLFNDNIILNIFEDLHNNYLVSDNVVIPSLYKIILLNYP